MTIPLEFQVLTQTLVAERLGLAVPEWRKADLAAAIAGILRSPESHDPGDRLARLAAAPENGPEWSRIIRALTVGETYFFRDRACFEALERNVLPALIAARRSRGGLRLRLWSAGCASGEEPYSLAILLDRMLPDRAAWTLTILATDINPDELETARRGLYREWSLRETPPAIRARYFRSGPGQVLELDPGIRALVTFDTLNLAAGQYPLDTAGMDLILCRNVLMYLTPAVQRAVVARFRGALAEDGWLIVSAVEASIGLFSPLVPVNFPGAIFYAKSSLRQGWRSTAPAPARVPLEAPETETSVPSETQPDPPSGPAREDEEILKRARVLADQGNLAGARRLCEAALGRDRLDVEAYFLLGAVCQELGELSRARDALGRAIYLCPDSAPAHLLLGGLLLRQGERGRGRRCLETAAHLLSAAPQDEAVPGGGGLTAGCLLKTALTYLESQ